MGIDDNNNNFKWWWNQLNTSEDWNAMSEPDRRRLLAKLQQCLVDLTSLNISDREMQELVKQTDIPTVFDAILSLWALPDVEKKNRWQVLAYLKRVIINSFKAQCNVKPHWHEEKNKPKSGKLATLEEIKRYNPSVFKHYCSICNRRILSSNKTGICTKCQSKGNGREREH